MIRPLTRSPKDRQERAAQRYDATRAITVTSVVDVPPRLSFAPLTGFEDLGYSAARLKVTRLPRFYPAAAAVLAVAALGRLRALAAAHVRRHRNECRRISAHRGGTEAVEPSTLKAFRQAVTAGVEYVEFDVQRTRDGQLVVFHDERAPSGAPISSLTLAELRGDLARDVPRIEEVMKIARGSTVCQIDLKEVGYELDVVDRALAIVGHHGLVVTTLEDESVRTIKDARPEVRVGLSLGRNMSDASVIRKIAVWLSELFPARRVRACGADFLSLQYRLARLTGLRFCARRQMNAFV